MNHRPQTGSGPGDQRIRGWLEAPREWSESHTADFTENLFLALDLYGASRDDGLVPQLVEAYRVAVGRLPVFVRSAVCRALAKPLNGRRQTVAGLIPIMMIEPDRGVVQSATFDILRFSRIDEGGRLLAEDVLFDILEGETAENPGAILAGLVLYSHPPLIARLARIRQTAGLTQTREACLSLQGSGLHLVLSFLFDWFVDVAQSSDETRGERLCALAAALMPGRDLYAEGASVKEIYAVADPVQRSMRYEPVRLWRASEYAQEMLPRLERDVAPVIEEDERRMLLSAWRRLAGAA